MYFIFQMIFSENHLLSVVENKTTCQKLLARSLQR